MYRRAVEEFNRLKALRHELPNEPICEAQPELGKALPPANQSQTNPANPTNPTKPTPAGNIPGRPPRFHPNGEPFVLPPHDPSPSPVPDPPNR
jgi:hypothetical protein